MHVVHHCVFYVHAGMHSIYTHSRTCIYVNLAINITRQNMPSLTALAACIVKQFILKDCRSDSSWFLEVYKHLLFVYIHKYIIDTAAHCLEHPTSAVSSGYVFVFSCGQADTVCSCPHRSA